MYSRTSYVFSLVTLAVVMVLLLRFVRSPFGLLCRGIKDDSLRGADDRRLGLSQTCRDVLVSRGSLRASAAH